MLLALLPGLTLGDCVLIAFAATLSVPAFDLFMSRYAPADGWRIALRCWFMGSGLIVAGIALAFLALYGFLLPQSHDEPLALAWPSLIAALIGSVSLVVMLRSGRSAIWWAIAATGAVIGQWSAYHGFAAAECVYAVAAAAAIVITGWRLAGGVVGDLLWASKR